MVEPWHYDATEGNPRGRQGGAVAIRFKFNMLRAMNADERLTPSAFKVASALLMIMNGETGDLFPAIAVVADATGLSERSVRYCLQRLRDTGWLTWRRGGRGRANTYEFDALNLEPMLAKIKDAERRRRVSKASKSAVPDRQQIASQPPDQPFADRQQIAVPDRQQIATQ